MSDTEAPDGLNAHSLWRLDIARRIAPAYVANPKVCAVVVQGSVSRGLADSYSDIEMRVFWREAPLDDERRECIAACGGILWKFWDYDEEWAEWSEEFGVGEVKLDMSHRTVADMERWLTDVISNFSTSLPKQDTISALQRSIPLYGEDVVEQWRLMAAHYPDDLAARMVQEHLQFGPAWWLEMLAEREALIPLYETFCAFERKILIVLLALNRIYLPHTKFKWTGQLVSELSFAPADLLARLRAVFLSEPKAGVKQLHSLIDDLFDLVGQQMPQIDISAARARLNEQRTLWDAAPDWPKNSAAL